MKNNLLLSLLFILCSIAAYAQTSGKAPSRVKKPKPIYEQVDQIIKVNIPSLFLKTIALQYEKKINKRTSFAAGIIYRPKSSSPFKNLFLNDTLQTISLSTREMIKSSRYTTFMFTPEWRFYFKKKALKGLYMAPFLRYKYESLSADFKYSDTNSFYHNGLLKGNANSFGAGILFGIQVLSRKKLSLDFWFAGPWVAYSKFKSISKINTGIMDEYRKADVESRIEPFNNMFGFDRNFKWSASGFETNRAGLGFGLRTFGINLGYAF